MTMTYHYPGLDAAVLIKGIEAFNIAFDLASGQISYTIWHKVGKPERILLPITSTIIIDNEDLLC